MSDKTENRDIEQEVIELLSLSAKANMLLGALRERMQEVARRVGLAEYSVSPRAGCALETVFEFSVNAKRREIIAKWDECFGRGGHDSGALEFPASYLYDEQVLVDFEEDLYFQKEQKKAEEEKVTLNKKRKKYEKLKAELESMPGTIWMKDR